MCFVCVAMRGGGFAVGRGHWDVLGLLCLMLLLTEFDTAAIDRPGFSDISMFCGSPRAGY